MSSADVRDSSLRLRLWASLVLFLSAYSPLMLIFIVQNIDLSPKFCLRAPIFSVALLVIAAFSVIFTLLVVRDVGAGLPVTVTKAINKSGDMFSYTIPYVLSFVRSDFSDWRIIFSLVVFLAVLFIMSYRTQSVFINPVLAIAGYLLIDCAFKRGDKELHALVITRQPIDAGDTIRLERLSHYLYINSHSKTEGAVTEK